MEIRFQNKNSWQCDIVLFFAFDADTAESLEKSHTELFEKASWISISPAWRDYKAKAKELLLLYGHKDNEISRAYAVGLGKSEKCTIETVKNAVATAVKACKGLNLEHIALDIASLKYILSKMTKNTPSLDSLVEEVCVAALLSLYSYDEYKSLEEEAFKVKSLNLLCDEAQMPENIQKAARLAEAAASGTALSRDLSNMPANALTPIAFAQKAEELAKKYNFKCTTFDKDKIEELGMNAFMAVAKGSRQDPRLVILEYTPKNCKHSDPYVIVGKGLTFDSGGISLKPSSGMGEMKTDMSGAADVLGLFEALGQGQFVCEPDRPIIGMLGCAENMPDGNAVKPGDIVRTYKGKTVEISNTDAEGRLVLIDVLAYAQEQYKPAVLIDIATLTGACVVALGDEAAGLFANDENLATNLLASSEKVGDRLWRLPLWPHMLEKIKSDVADLDNAGPRWGGALTAAVFIESFIDEDQVWAHIDIAGPNFASAPSAYCPKGGTGFGTRILIDFVLNN